MNHWKKCIPGEANHICKSQSCSLVIQQVKALSLQWLGCHGFDPWQELPHIMTIVHK